MKVTEILDYDLILDEEELQTKLGQIYQRAVEYEETINKYAAIIESVVTNSVIKGNVAENLKLFQMEVSALQGEIADIAIMVYNLTQSYLYAIDDADSYLY